MRSLTIASVLALVGCGAPAPEEPPPSRLPPDRPQFAGRESDAVKQALPGGDRDALEQPGQLEFFAVHPYPGAADAAAARAGDALHGYTVLGGVTLTDPAQRRALVEALYLGLNGPYGPAPACFNPRHALRARRGEQTVEVLLCYECETAQVFSAAHAGGLKTVRLSKTGEDALDGLLRAHGLVKHVDPPR